jgi:hypothetical protein
LSRFRARRGRVPRGPVKVREGRCWVSYDGMGDSGRRADGVGGPWDASLVVPGRGGGRRGARTPSPEGAATRTASTRAAASRRLDAVDAAT